jgi:hypothetical protein
MEALAAGGAMAVMAEQGKTMAFRELDDTKFEEWLVFLRSDAGGRYARGVTTAFRDALLARSAIFASTLVDVMRQIRDRPQA